MSAEEIGQAFAEATKESAPELAAHLSGAHETNPEATEAESSSKTESRPSAVADEDRLLELAGKLSEGNYSAEQVGKIRTGLAERGLLTEDVDAEGPKGALTHALVEAERHAGIRDDVSEAAAERGKKPEDQEQMIGEAREKVAKAVAAEPKPTKGERRVARTEGKMIDVADRAETAAPVAVAAEATPSAEAPKTLVKNKERAEAEAWAQDREARKLAEIDQYYGARAKEVKDHRESQRIGELRKAAIAAERERFKTISEETMEFAGQVLENARTGQYARDTLDKSEPNFADKAMAIREVFGLEPVPFLEEKSGGLFHRAARRGPKMVDSYFRTPGEDKLVVMERRNRRTGELVSQTVLTSHEPIRTRRGMLSQSELPPRKIRAEVEEVRQHDQSILQQEAGNALGSRNVGDFVSGFLTGRVFDSIYSDSYGANGDQVNKYKYGRKRGGFLYWLTGGRV